MSYAFLGAEEGLYSLELSKNTDPVMEQVDISLFVSKLQALRLQVTTLIPHRIRTLEAYA